MDGDLILQKMLNGVPLVDFIAFYIWALIGFLIVFGISVQSRAKQSGWSWPAFWLGWKRVLVSLALIAAGIVFWPQISQFIFNNDTPVQLNMWSSFLLGISLDQLRSWIRSLAKKKPTG